MIRTRRAARVSRARSIGLRMAAIAACLVSGAPFALAQTHSAYPERAVRFILPFGPGSATDIAARLIAEKLQAKWGKPIVVEPRPGGDGLIAINAFLSANDDHVFCGNALRDQRTQHNRTTQQSNDL